MKKTKYNNGLPFSTGLDKSLNKLGDRIFKKKKASCIIVDGGVGEGKTTLSVHIADFVNGGPINLKEQLALGADDFRKKLKQCYKNGHKVIIFDEAGEFDKRGAITRLNKMLNRIFELYRAFRILVIITLPDFYQLDNKLFDNKIPRLLIHCYGKGETYGNYKAYSLRRMFYLRDKMSKITVKPDAFSQIRQNYFGHFLDLESERSGQLDKMTTSGKIDILEEKEIKDANLVSTSELMKILGRSYVWVKKNIDRLEIKPDKIFKRTKYYHNHVIDMISKELKYK